MPRLLLTLLTLCALGLDAGQAAETSPLPFPVTIGGQVATFRDVETVARLAKPVPNSAAISIEVNSEIIVINLAPADAQGVPLPKIPPRSIVFQGTTKGSLADTVDKQPLTPGNYLVSVTAQSRTATIFLKIE